MKEWVLEVFFHHINQKLNFLQFTFVLVRTRVGTAGVTATLAAAVSFSSSTQRVGESATVLFRRLGSIQR